jgi:hypothetical protein
MLLLGRLADFASRDLARKRKVMKSQPANTKGQSPPMFPGLLPSKGKFTLPAGFSPPRDPSPQSEGADDGDLEASTAAAMQEWDSICQALDRFKSYLGPDFDPMDPEIEPPAVTPFGPCLRYRTYSIAGIWMNYYMGLILLYRAHPSMPPIAMQAAGKAARQTAGWANDIGRIAAGLHDECSNVTAVSTLIGAAFIECCFCLFVAGVQVRNCRFVNMAMFLAPS